MKKAYGSITTQNLVPAGEATANSAVEIVDLLDEGVLAIQVDGTYTGALSVQGRVNGRGWVTLAGITSINTGVTAGTIASAATGIFKADAAGFEAVRVTGLAAMTGSAGVAIRAVASPAFANDISVSLEAGDVSIGAVEVKNATTDDRMTVAPDGRAATDANLQVGNADAPGGAGAVSASTPRVTLADNDPAVIALQVLDDWDEADRAKVNPIVGQAGVAAGSGAVSAATQRVVGSNAQNITILASAARTTTSAGEAAVSGLGGYRAVEFQLDVTAAATDAGDTLDAFVQTTIDGTNWLDIAHFTQVLGNGGAKRFVAKVVGDLAEAMFETGSALAAGSVRHLLGDQYRVRYDIVDAGTVNASFTFSVKANALP